MASGGAEDAPVVQELPQLTQRHGGGWHRNSRDYDDADAADLSLGTDFRARFKAINQHLDNDLDDMSACLSRIRGLAVGLGSEIEDRNQKIDRIHSKAERADLNISSQNTQMKKIIKR
ncbi:hypothetical protein Pmani_001077 [Petrolisthes manimaculis]|uniref:t-SNARE coiled-coil homology domain-containing protein n=1 Tax=Petrolisthes manimaculis TaxID=1843537 RepID=A0AAE1QLD6_9EUCA|nr:hypothetical protein Pmani_001077 [Petrolisthes manimaculis]